MDWQAIDVLIYGAITLIVLAVAAHLLTIVQAIRGWRKCDRCQRWVKNPNAVFCTRCRGVLVMPWVTKRGVE